MNAIISKYAGKASSAWKPTSKNIVWMMGGIVLSSVVAVSAQVMSSPPTEADCDLVKAMKDAVNSKVAMIDATAPDPAKYFQMGGPDSCLGEIAIANIDLSRLIPDIAGLLTDGVTSAMTKLVDGAMKKACAAARNSVGGIVGQYNGAIGTVNGFGDGIGSAVTGSIDGAAGRVAGQYGVDYSSSPSSSKGASDVLAGVTIPNTFNTSTTARVASPLTQNASNTGIVTRAASSLEQARINLQQAQAQSQAQAQLSENGSGNSAQLQAAQAQYDSAQRDYTEAQRQVAAPVQSITPVKPATPATIGSSVFGR